MSNKGRVQKNKSSRGGKQRKKRMTVVVFVAANGSKPCNPVTILRSKFPRCFRKFVVPTPPVGLHWFANAKSWMATEVMKCFLGQLDRQMKRENRPVLRFLNNAPCHPATLQEPLNFMKLEFLPKKQLHLCNLLI